jgi:hypothetical protein
MSVTVSVRGFNGVRRVEIRKEEMPEQWKECLNCTYVFIRRAIKLRVTVVWVVASCSLVDGYRRFRGSRCFHHQDDENIRSSPDDGGSKHLWNVGKLLPDHTAHYPRRQPSSYSPQWEPQISPVVRHRSNCQGMSLTNYVHFIHQSFVRVNFICRWHFGDKL